MESCEKGCPSSAIILMCGAQFLARKSHMIFYMFQFQQGKLHLKPIWEAIKGPSCSPTLTTQNKLVSLVCIIVLYACIALVLWVELCIIIVELC